MFNLFHRYNKLVRRDLARPLKHTCGSGYITAMGEDEELVLRCLSCGTDTVPGIGTIGRVRAVVKEHFLDD